MDTDLLVDNQIDDGQRLDGQRLIDQLTREEFEVLVAFWIRISEEGQWQLYLASPAIDPEKMGEAYRKVYSSLRKLEQSCVTASDLNLLNGANPVAQAALRIRDRYPGRSPTRFHGKRLGNISIEEAYIYPPAEKWFTGFDEIKRIFPSATVFTIPVLYEDSHPAKLGAYMGSINVANFEGRAPGTVMFQGPKGSSGKRLAELYFIHRPEGWNTLYRADTQRYEEVRHVATGEPIYRSVDFGPLAALKTQEKPGEDQIQWIQSLMATGHYITLGPDPTPIHSIPYTPPAKAGAAAEQPLDWEGVRLFIQSGGTVQAHASEKK